MDLLSYYIGRLFFAPTGKSVGCADLVGVINGYFTDEITEHLSYQVAMVNTAGRLVPAEKLRPTATMSPIRFTFSDMQDDFILFSIIIPMHEDGYISDEEFNNIIRITTPQLVILSNHETYSYFDRGYAGSSEIASYIWRLSYLSLRATHTSGINSAVLNKSVEEGLLELPDDWVERVIEGYQSIPNVNLVFDQLSPRIYFPDNFSDRMVMQKLLAPPPPEDDYDY